MSRWPCCSVCPNHRCSSSCNERSQTSPVSSTGVAKATESHPGSQMYRKILQSSTDKWVSIFPLWIKLCVFRTLNVSVNLDFAWALVRVELWPSVIKKDSKECNCFFVSHQKTLFASYDSIGRWKMAVLDKQWVTANLMTSSVLMLSFAHSLKMRFRLAFTHWVQKFSIILLGVKVKSLLLFFFFKSQAFLYKG